MGGRRIRIFVSAAVVVGLLAVVAPPAQAWKPYTHNFAAEVALDDAADGFVTINGRPYALDDRVAEALAAKPAHYRAGVVGPDGFPDLIMGQAVIHPENTGAWLTHVLDTAWAAQEPASAYTEDEQLAILAFGYGFLTHAAGDMWAHTLVNNYAEGVFPPFSDVLTDPESAAIALRHIIVEGYVGDATPGFDANDDRTLVEGTWSDDSTPGIAYAAPPSAWLWETFIGRQKNADGHFVDALPGQPTADRGPFINGFYDLHNELRTFAEGSWSTAGIIACIASVVCAPFANIPYQIARSYADAWADDIESGLRNWAPIGLSFTAGLFDPATRRAAQDSLCDDGDDATSSARAACEAEVSVLDTMLWYLDEGDYLTVEGPRLFSMLGAPDLLLEFQEFTETVSEFLDVINFPNPLADIITDIKEFIKELVFDALSEVLGFDVDVFLSALTEPGAYLSNDFPEPLPPPLDIFNDTGLFDDNALDEINALMGVDAALVDGRLPDDAELDLDGFAPLSNTAVLSRLVLLSETSLDRLLTDELGRPVTTYSDAAADDGGTNRRQNIMTTGLDGMPWLLNIDSDHAWRADGLPVFGPDDRPADLHGGTGQMPIWESCMLRPAFGTLFTDWENGAEQFPALGDSPSADPVNDPAPPVSTLVQSAGVVFDDGTDVYVNTDNEFLLTAVDEGPKSFSADQVRVRYRVNGGDWLTGESGQTFSLAGADGLYVVEYQAADPCHTFDPADDADGLIAEAVQTAEFWLDSTPPELVCPSPPFGQEYDTADPVTVDFDLDDGPTGSGVASQSATIDGFEVLPGVVAIVDGESIDTYDFYVGVRTVTVTAADHLGNSATGACSFEIHATAASLRENVDRGLADGDIASNMAKPLQAKLEHAQAKHERGQHAVEARAVAAFVNGVEAQSGKKIDSVLAARLIAAGLDVVDRQP